MNYAFFVAVWLLAACGGGGSGADSGVDSGASDAATSDTGGDGASTITSTQACTDQANARCAKIAMCEPFFGGVSRSYPDMATCVSRNVDACMSGLTASMTAQNPAHVEGCAQSIANETCADFRSGVTSTACISPAGPLANGSPCVANAQCSSAFCAIPRGGQCGACAAQPVAGDACTLDADCGQTLACSTNMTCQTPADVGAACGPDAPCRGGLVCVRAAADAGASGSCQALGSAVGAACNARNVGNPQCDFDFGLFCNTMNQCAMSMQSMPGAACGIMGSGVSAADCTGGATCEGPTGSKTCIAPAIEGQPCDTANGPTCLAPARCITTGGDAGAGPDGGAPTAGVCRLFDPAACP